MPQNHSLTRFLYLLLVCLLALPLAGLATGQSRFQRQRLVSFDQGYPATASVALRGTGRSAPEGLLLVELRGRADQVFAREQIALKVTAVDAAGVLIRDASLVIDFGDGKVETFPLDRRADITHAWKQKGTYQMEFSLTAQGNLAARGKMRVRVGGPLRVFLQIFGETSPRLDEANRYRFVAFAREGRSVQGRLTIDWGDGTTTTVSHFSDEALRGHTYAKEGKYVITATLTYNDGGKQKSRTFQVEATKTGGAIDLSQGTVAINSDRNIANFKVTSTVTNATISTSQICIFHSKAGGWPAKNGLEGNPWVAAFVAGQLHLGTYEWLRPGQICKSITKANIGPHVKHGALGSWRPAKGETVYLFVSTLARLGVSSSNERAEPFAIVWPY